VKDLAKQHSLVLLYTPPYSPWFNPTIEGKGIFSIIKREFYYKHGSIEGSYNCITKAHLEAFMDRSLRIRGMS
jgi:transposase